MKIHTPLGKVIYWLGFLLFILGIGFNENFGIISDSPGILTSFSIPAIIIGIILLLISNFFKKRNKK